jgi:hypothetical protein
VIAGVLAVLRQRLRAWLLSADELERLGSPPVASQVMPAAEPPFEPEDPANWVSLDYIEEVVQDRMERQSDAWDLVDGRLRLILGVVGIIFAAVLGFQRGQSQLDYHVVVLINLAVALFLFAGIVAALAYLPGDFNWPPNPEDLRLYQTTELRKTKKDIVDSMIFRGYNRNEVLILRKTNAFRLAFGVTAVAITVLAVALMNHIAGQSREPDCSVWLWLIRPACEWLTTR